MSKGSPVEADVVGLKKPQSGWKDPSRDVIGGSHGPQGRDFGKSGSCKERLGGEKMPGVGKSGCVGLGKACFA